MQRLILQHVYDWEKNNIDFELDTVHSRTFTPVVRTPMAPVDKHPSQRPSRHREHPWQAGHQRRRWTRTVQVRSLSSLFYLPLASRLRVAL